MGVVCTFISHAHLIYLQPHHHRKHSLTPVMEEENQATLVDDEVEMNCDQPASFITEEPSKRFTPQLDRSDKLTDDELEADSFTELLLKHERLREPGSDKLTDSPLLDYVRSFTKLDSDTSDNNSPSSKNNKVRNFKVGYIDAAPSEIGAVPMRGKHRNDWLKVQVTTFTNWVNDRLSGSRANYNGPVVHDLKLDFQDGLLLIQLLESLTSKKIQRIVKNPIFTAQKIANLDLLFEFMRSEGVHLTAIGKNIYIVIRILL